MEFIIIGLYIWEKLSRNDKEIVVDNVLQRKIKRRKKGFKDCETKLGKVEKESRNYAMG